MKVSGGGMTADRIAIEEHFWTAELRELRRGHDVLSDPELGRRLSDLGALRIREMDEAGIDLQVISHVEPATQNFEPDEAVRLAAAANDLLHQAIRLVLSEVLDVFPRLQIILGHLGEALPFLLPRVDRYVSRQMKGRTFRDSIRKNFHFTTGGKFTHTALQCTIEEIGIERVMFAVDWPFHSNLDGSAFIETAPIGDDAKAMIFGSNARRLLRI